MVKRGEVHAAHRLHLPLKGVEARFFRPTDAHGIETGLSDRIAHVGIDELAHAFGLSVREIGQGIGDAPRAVGLVPDGEAGRTAVEAVETALDRQVSNQVEKASIGLQESVKRGRVMSLRRSRERRFKRR